MLEVLKFMVFGTNKSMCKILKNGFRTIDLVARYGGEEFAVVLLNTSKSKSFDSIWLATNPPMESIMIGSDELIFARVKGRFLLHSCNFHDFGRRDW